MDDRETVLLIDSWAERQFLEVHHASPMMETMQELREKYDLQMKVERYRSGETRAMAKGESFIRKYRIDAMAKADVSGTEIWKCEKEWCTGKDA